MANAVSDEERKQELQKELAQIDARRLKPSDDIVTKEKPGLRKRYLRVVVTLCVALAASLLALLYVADHCSGQTGVIYVMALLAGVAGSSVSALVSVNRRYAGGLEFSNGTRYPDQDKKERFNCRLVVGFLTRPLLGAATGPLVALGLSAGIFKDADPNKLAVVVFWSSLGGLFAKTLIDKLKDLFANLIGAKS